MTKTVLAAGSCLLLSSSVLFCPQGGRAAYWLQQERSSAWARTSEAASASRVFSMGYLAIRPLQVREAAGSIPTRAGLLSSKSPRLMDTSLKAVKPVEADPPGVG